LVDLRADAELQERLDFLADRSSEGQLTPEERSEYETYVQALHVMAILQARLASFSRRSRPDGCRDSR
jgi:hypothetical protein